MFALLHTFICGGRTCAERMLALSPCCSLFCACHRSSPPPTKPRFSNMLARGIDLPCEAACAEYCGGIVRRCCPQGRRVPPQKEQQPLVRGLVLAHSGCIRARLFCGAPRPSLVGCGCGAAMPRLPWSRSGSGAGVAKLHIHASVASRGGGRAELAPDASGKRSGPTGFFWAWQ